MDSMYSVEDALSENQKKQYNQKKKKKKKKKAVYVYEKELLLGGLPTGLECNSPRFKTGLLPTYVMDFQRLSRLSMAKGAVRNPP